jgi:spermidine synthase
VGAWNIAEPDPGPVRGTARPPISSLPVSRAAPVTTRSFLAGAFLSAFASFQIQPLMTKLILPWFGGGPWVWAISLVFYQSLLLAGYLYSHFLTRVLSTRHQVAVHVALFSCGALLLLWHQWNWPLAILPGETWHPRGHDPTLSILSILIASVGFPYFLLSTTSPLIQTWFVAARKETPYRLYAISNLGSLAGLLSYPLLVEPWLDARQQTAFWLALFLAAGVTCALAGRAGARSSATEPVGNSRQAEEERPDPSTWLKWFVFAAIPSALLVSTTTLITETVAAVPLLWVAPLALYLMTLIATFQSERWHLRGPIHASFALFAFAAAVALSPWGAFLDAPHSLTIFAGALFFGAYSCHIELARSRPAPANLTRYYLAISLGGAVGGATVSLGAPVLLPDFWEFHMSLFACAVVVVVALLADSESWLRRPQRWVTLAPFVTLLCFEGRLGFYWLQPAMVRAGRFQTLALGATLAGMAGLAFLDRNRRAVPRTLSPAQFFVTLLLAPLGMTLADDAAMSHHGVIARARSFYGVLTVEESNPGTENAALVLQDGVTTHGLQLKDPARRLEPTAYYHPQTGVYRAFEALKAAHPDRPLRVGVIGLGAGTLATYARARDSVKFYEIDPNDIGFARAHFTFLKECAGAVEIAEGDGRLSIEEEVLAGRSQGFDLLVLDAFNGDTLPVHLLTSEAFDLYRRELRDSSSVIAVNISNRYLDLEPVIARAGEHLGFEVRMTSSSDRENGHHPVTWALVSGNATAIEVGSEGEWRKANQDPALRLWTDAYSNILEVMRWWRG